MSDTNTAVEVLILAGANVNVLTVVKTALEFDVVSSREDLILFALGRVYLLRDDCLNRARALQA